MNFREAKSQEIAAWMLAHISASKNNPPSVIADGLFETFNTQVGIESRHKFREGCQLALTEVKVANTLENNIPLNVLMQLRPQIEVGAPALRR